MKAGRKLKKLILFGTDHNGWFYRELLHQIQEQISFTFWGNGTVKDYGNAPQLEIWETEELSGVDTKETILFLKKRANLKKIRYLSADTIVIVNSENERQLELISKFKARMITTGMSQKDTVTFSSKGEESCVISLQRMVSAVDGEALEPMEVSCKKLGNCDDFSLLSYAAIMMTLDLLDGKGNIHLSLNGPHEREGFFKREEKKKLQEISSYK